MMRPRHLPLRRQTNRLNDFFLDTFIIAEEKAQKHDVNILLQLKAPHIFCSFDYYQLQEALLNIIASAVDASPKDGEVAVRSWCTNNCFEIEVEVGERRLPDHLVDFSFQPFYSDITKGVGFGLAVAEQIIEAHGGKFQCERQESQEKVLRIVLPGAVS